LCYINIIVISESLSNPPLYSGGNVQ
jgi:hypothetical protein